MYQTALTAGSLYCSTDGHTMTSHNYYNYRAREACTQTQLCIIHSSKCIGDQVNPYTRCGWAAREC